MKDYSNKFKLEHIPPTRNYNEGRKYVNSFSDISVIPQYALFEKGVVGFVIQSPRWSSHLFLDKGNEHGELVNFILKLYCPDCPSTYAELMLINVLP